MKQDDLLKTRVDLDDMLKMQKSMDDAQKDDTPFAVVSDDGVVVAGDVNKTERKSRDYSIRFRFPESHMKDLGIDEKDVIDRVAGYIVIQLDFNDVYIVPRRDIDIEAAIVKVIPYFQKLQDDGISTEDRSAEEMRDFTKTLSNEIIDDLYDLVSAVLNVDRRITQNMVLNDVIDTATRMPQDFPEVFRAADHFFEHSS